MARKKAAKRTRRGFRKTTRSVARRAGVGKSTNLIQLDAMIYGAGRSWLSSAIAPVTSKIPIVGGLADEVGMGLLTWAVAKNSSGMIRDIAIKGLVVENAAVGAGVAGGILGGSSTTAAQQGFLYG